MLEERDSVTLDWVAVHNFTFTAFLVDFLVRAFPAHRLR